MSLHVVSLYCLAKLLMGEYDVPQQLPLQQKRQWLKSLLWFVIPLHHYLLKIWRHVVRFWQFLLYAPPNYQYPQKDLETLLGFLSDIAEGKRPLFDNGEYPSPDTSITPPKTILKGGLQGVNRKREEPTDMSADEKRQKIEETVLQLRHNKVSQLLRDFAKAEKISYYIAVDDLDKHWRPESKESIGLLLGLLAEVDKLQRYFLGSLKIVLFLREDIYEVLLQHDAELPKRNLLRMQWTVSNLKHVVAERIAAGASAKNEDDDATWSSVFCPHVRNQITNDYIVSRTLPRPRDILDFCQKAIDQAQRNGHDIVTAEDVLDAEAEFSESLFRSICLEYRTVYPKLEDVLLEFVEARHIMGWKEFEELGHTILASHRKIIDTWYGVDNPDIHYLSSVLFRIGFIGFAQSGRQFRLFADGRSFRETWSLVRPAPQVEIHPTFHRVLEIKVEGAPLAVARRRRKSLVDDRQMHLDLNVKSDQSGT